MNVRTVSRLPQLETLDNEDLFQVSEYINDIKYTSKKLSYYTLYGKISTDMDEDFSVKYNINPEDIPNLNDDINDLNEKIVDLSDDIGEINLNIERMEEITPSWDIKNIDGYISPSRSTKVVGQDNLFKFNFDENSKVSNEATMNKTGNFFCYGWLTAPRTMDPADAWVAVETKNLNGDWMMISLSPWILGSKSNIMQYIGFNCPVQKDNKVRITTGFQVVDYGHSFANRGLVLNINSQETESNINNTFIGYMIG